MKKLLLATAIAASVATGANAATTYNVTSNITNIQLWLPSPSTELMTSEPGGSFTGLQFGGQAFDANDDGIIDSSSLTMTGVVNFTAATLPIRLTFDINNGTYSANGTTFTGGTIQVDAYTTEAGWQAFSTIDASATNLPFLAGQAGHLGTNSTAGLLLAPGTTALPGLWDGQQPSGVGIDNAVSALTLLGNTSGMYLDGTITLTPVPVPAAAWLFGSAMLGLAGVSRKRKVTA
jgi:hypothetical protein